MKRVKKKNDIYTCPSCKQVKYATEFDYALKALQAYYRKKMPSIYGSIKRDLVNSFANDELDWACDDCFDKGKAIAANPELIFDGGEPNLAHYDSEMKCSRCEIEFIFSKTEKKFWYEQLQFHIDAEPKNCVACRKIVREEKKDNSRLSQLMSQENPLTKVELEEVSKIYERMGKEEKKRMYENLARRSKDK